MGEPDRSASERWEVFAEAMRAGGLKDPVEPELRADIWRKLLGNISTETTTVCAYCGTGCNLTPARAGQ